jgi:hypothetical protein
MMGITKTHIIGRIFLDLKFLQEAYSIKFHQYLQINRPCAFCKHMGNQQIAAFFEMLGYAIRERLHHRPNNTS